MRSTNKSVVARIRGYIIDNIDHEYFGLTASPDFPTACKLILRACRIEKQCSLGEFRYEVFKDWATGLPTAFNTCYYYNVSAIDLLDRWLETTSGGKYSEQQAEDRITQLIYRELVKGAKD